MKGSLLVERILWISIVAFWLMKLSAIPWLSLLSAIIYSAWRRNGRPRVCRACGSDSLVPPDLPIGQKLMAEHPSAINLAPVESRILGNVHWVGRVVFAIAVLLVIRGVVSDYPAEPAEETRAADNTSHLVSDESKTQDELALIEAAPTTTLSVLASAPPEDIYRTTASALHAAYAANEVAVDTEIGNKRIEVRGKLVSIDLDFTNDVVLRMEATQPYDTVGLALVDSQRGKAAKLVKGQRVTVRCAAMKRILGDPMGKDCVVLVM